jgi:uncharacterized damage-inducible protein DinB
LNVLSNAGVSTKSSHTAENEMTPEEVRVLFTYDAWANERTLDSCAPLTPEQFTRNLGSSFPSVRDTLMHISGAHWVWLERLQGRSPAGLTLANEYGDLPAVRARVAEIQNDLAARVGSLSSADLEAKLAYRNIQGQPFHDPVWQILQHLANHGSYHRGQVAAMLRQLGAKPVSTDLIAFYRERSAAAAG